MALTKVAPAGIGTTPGDGYRIGNSFLHTTGVEITNVNATGIVTAASLDISGAIDFDGHTELDNINVSGVSTFAGLVDANGNVELGTNASNTVTFHADVGSALIPVADNTHALGANGARWSKLWVNEIDANANVSISDKIIHTGDTNTAIRFPANDTFAVELGGDERLRITTTGTAQIKGASGEAEIDFMRTNAAGSNGNTFGKIAWLDNNNNDVASLRAVRQSAVDDASVVISTRPTGGSITERLRIDSSGIVKIPNILDVPTIRRQVQNGSVLIAGGNATNDGANLAMYGSTHSSQANVFEFRTSSTERLRITSGGALLVGTASPFYGSGDMQHEIRKDNSRTYTAPVMTGHSHLLLNNSDTTTNAFCGLGFRAGSGDGSIGYVYTGTANAADFVINTDGGSNGIERLRVESGGNVRIGALNTGRLIIGHTASRSVAGGFATLQVQRNSSEAAHFIRTSNDNGAPILALAKSRSSGGAVCQAGDKIGVLGWYPHDGTDCNHAAAEIHAEVVSGIGGNDVPGDLVFKTNSGTTTTTERVRIKSDGQIVKNQGANVTSLKTYNSNADTFTLDHYQYQVSSTYQRYTDIVSIGDGTWGSNIRLFTNANGSQNGLERLRITSDGNVGINEATPLHKLHVKNTQTTNSAVVFDSSIASSTLSGNTATNGYGHALCLENSNTTAQNIVSLGFQVRTSGSWANAAITNKAVNTSGDTELSFWNEESNTIKERMRIYADGHITMFGSGPWSDPGVTDFRMFNGNFDIADDTTVTIQDAANTGCLVCVGSFKRDGGSVTYASALFFVTYASTSVTKISDPRGIFSVNDSDGYVCVTKSSVTSGTFYIKNRIGTTNKLCVNVINLQGL